MASPTTTAHRPARAPGSGAAFVRSPPPAPGDAIWALAAATSLFAAPISEVLAVLNALVGELLPSERSIVVGVLTGDCSRAPLKVAGPEALAGGITSTELAALSDQAAPGAPWLGTATIAGRPQEVLAVAAAPPGAVGSLFAIPLAAGHYPTAEQIALIDGLCQITALAWTDHAVRAEPDTTATSLAIRQERNRAVAELGDAHEATLAAILATLRARTASDQAARAAATDLAVSALIDLRDRGDRDRDLTEERAGEAFDRLREQLAPITRYATAQVELVGPGPTATDAATDASTVALSPDAVPATLVADASRFLPADIAHAARATSRGVALVLLEQDGVTRLRIGWQLGPRELVMTARDDGPGTVCTNDLAVHRIKERVETLGGSVSVDGVPGWGTTVSASLPLSPPLVTADESPLAVLNAREREVLAELARGSRNAQIADALTITSHTVKFHVANILRKLGVSSRGEAAALAHEHGVS